MRRVSRLLRCVLPFAASLSLLAPAGAQSAREVVWSGYKSEPVGAAVTEIYAVNPAAGEVAEPTQARIKSKPAVQAAAPDLAAPPAEIRAVGAENLEPPPAPAAPMPKPDLPVTTGGYEAADAIPPQNPGGLEAPPVSPDVTAPPVPPDVTAPPVPIGAPASNLSAPAGNISPAPATTASPQTPAPAPSGASQTPPAGPLLPAMASSVKQAVDALVETDIDGSQAAELRKEHAAVAAYYAARDYAPLWIEDGKPTAAVSAVMDRLAHAADDGLDLSALPVPIFAGEEDKLAAADVALSAQVVAYGRQASGSRVDPRTISDLIGAKPELADPALILAAVVAAGSAGADLLHSFNPPQKQYQELRAKLAELRADQTNSAGPTIPAGRSLRVGMTDPRVPLIRARFGLDAGSGDSDLYDSQVAAAVADYQRASGLAASGILTDRTVKSLSQPAGLEHEIIANMELWRWMPRDLGSSRIDVNIPGFMATVVRAGEVVSRHKVIVGKPDTPTPVFSNTMKFLIINPYWNVPASIVRKEMLPRVGGDPEYLAEMGFEVFSRDGQLFVRQPPGAANALGRIKFMFPNQYSVYLHDTPSRSLFAASRRAFSHGCVRVEQPFEFAQSVLGPDWPEARIKGLVGGDERYVYLPKPLPIHIEYFTAHFDDSGQLQIHDDIYGYARKVEVALGLEKPEAVDYLQTSEAADEERAPASDQERMPFRWPRRSQTNWRYEFRPNEDRPLIAGHP